MDKIQKQKAETNILQNLLLSLNDIKSNPTQQNYKFDNNNNYLLKLKDEKISFLQKQCDELQKQLQIKNEKIFNTDTSTNFPVKSEIKKIWEEIAFVSILDTFIDFESEPEKIFYLVSEMFYIINILINEFCNEIYLKVSKSLNITSNDKKFISEVEKVARPLIKENLNKIFIETENKPFIDKFKFLYKEKIENFNLFKFNKGDKHKISSIIEGEDFKIMIKKIKDIFLYTKFNDQQLFFKIDPDINKRNPEKIKIKHNEKKNYLIINDNNINNNDVFGIIILKPPVLRSGFIFNNYFKTIVMLFEENGYQIDGNSFTIGEKKSNSINKNKIKNTLPYTIKDIKLIKTKLINNNYNNNLISNKESPNKNSNLLLVKTNTSQNNKSNCSSNNMNNKKKIYKNLTQFVNSSEPNYNKTTKHKIKQIVNQNIKNKNNNNNETFNESLIKPPNYNINYSNKDLMKNNNYDDTRSFENMKIIKRTKTNNEQKIFNSSKPNIFNTNDGKENTLYEINNKNKVINNMIYRRDNKGKISGINSKNADNNKLSKEQLIKNNNDIYPSPSDINNNLNDNLNIIFKKYKTVKQMNCVNNNSSNNVPLVTQKKQSPINKKVHINNISKKKIFTTNPKNNNGIREKLNIPKKINNIINNSSSYNSNKNSSSANNLSMNKVYYNNHTINSNHNNNITNENSNQKEFILFKNYINYNSNPSNCNKVNHFISIHKNTNNNINNNIIRNSETSGDADFKIKNVNINYFNIMQPNELFFGQQSTRSKSRSNNQFTINNNNNNQNINSQAHIKHTKSNNEKNLLRIIPDLPKIKRSKEKIYKSKLLIDHSYNESDVVNNNLQNSLETSHISNMNQRKRNKDNNLIINNKQNSFVKIVNKKCKNQRNNNSKKFLNDNKISVLYGEFNGRTKQKLLTQTLIAENDNSNNNFINSNTIIANNNKGFLNFDSFNK